MNITFWVNTNLSNVCGADCFYSYLIFLKSSPIEGVQILGKMMTCEPQPSLPVVAKLLKGPDNFLLF